MSVIDSINQARQSGYSDDQILDEISRQNPDKGQVILKAKSSGYQSADVLNEIVRQNTSTQTQQPKKPEMPYFIKDVVQGASPAETNSGQGFFGTLGNFAKNIYQNTIGSKGLAGVAQMPGRVLAQPGMISDTTSGFQQVGDLANQAGNAYVQARQTTDPVQKAKLLQFAQSTQQNAGQLDTSTKTLADNIFTPGQAVGTAANAALTVGTFGTDSVLSNILKTTLPDSALATNVARLAQPLVAGTSDISKGLAAARLGVRTAESVGTGLAYNTASNMANGEDPMANTGSAALISALIPAGGALFNKALNESSPRLIQGAQRMYQSAMKPVGTAAEKSSVVQTGLREGIVLSEAGIEKTTTRIDSLEEQLGHAIDLAGANGKQIPTASLDRFVTAVKENFKYISDIAYRDKAVEDIDNVLNNFKKQYGNYLPVDVAQKIKTNTYQWLRNAYGELSSPIKEANKQLVRGLKEGIVNAAPIVADINPRLGKLYEFDAALERSLGRAKNYNLLGLGTKILSLKEGKMGTVMALASHVLGNLTNKSRIAIYMDRLGRIMGELTPIQRSELFVRYPVLKNIYARLSGVTGDVANSRSPLSPRLQLPAGHSQLPTIHLPGATDEYIKSLGL
jgi:hypothetical protein